MKDIKTFADLLAPITLDAFFDQYFDKQPLHISGTESKFAGVADFNTLQRLLNMTAIWSSASLQLVLDRNRIPPPAYCEKTVNRDGQEILQPDPDKVMEHLRLGASLVANDIDSLTPEIAKISEILEQSLTVKTQANLYYSWKQRQAFSSHFDTHDVYAVHLVGEKTWRIYKNRMPHPIRHPSFQFDDAYLEANRGDLLTEVTLKPGDILYLPRGQFHDAMASTEGAIHIAFSATGVIGLDFMNAMTDMVVGSEVYRRNFPQPSEGRDALKGHLKSLCAEISRIAESDAFLTQFENFQKNFKYKRGGISIPADGSEMVYEIANPALKVDRFRSGLGLFGPQGVIPIPPERTALVKWIFEKRRFSFPQLADAFADQSPMALNETLIEVCRMGILRQSQS